MWKQLREKNINYTSHSWIFYNIYYRFFSKKVPSFKFFQKWQIALFNFSAAYFIYYKISLTYANQWKYFSIWRFIYYKGKGIFICRLKTNMKEEIICFWKKSQILLWWFSYLMNIMIPLNNNITWKSDTKWKHFLSRNLRVRSCSPPPL